MKFPFAVIFVVLVIVLTLSSCKGAAKPVPAEPTQKRIGEEPKKPTPEEEKALAQEKLLKEAKEEFDRLCKEADQLVTQKAFWEAFETLHSYPEKYAQTEFAQRIEEKIAQIAQELIRCADVLAAENNTASTILALVLLDDYVKKYEQTPSWKLVKEKYDEIKEKLEQEIQRRAR
jgi:hypothetical protein